MAKFRILVTAPYMLPVIDDYRDLFARHDAEIIKADVEERLEEADLLPLVGDIDGVICGDDRFTAKAIDAAPRLKAIVKWGTGIDSIDSDAAAARGIVVGRTLDAFTEPVADSVMGYILAFARNIATMDHHMKAGTWEKISGRALNESTIGVIGVGATGSGVLRRARAFGARLLGTDIRTLQPGHVAALGVDMVSLEELLADADFVSVNCDLNPTSDHLMNDGRFAAMKNTAYFINCARGPVVDEPALIRALESGAIAGAGLDVFAHEPLPADSPFRGMGNVLLAPHNSNSSAKAWQRVHESTLEQMFRALAEAVDA
jgi:D-3-phosphoglycerate dehydrogenase / 2-oxoglutarate reductase